ncbi:MAG: hypothetical protein KDK02_03025 [Rhodobacteraceae bacterium]|nr:hypothetical protein [Paracoccaceae bacterium]
MFGVVLWSNPEENKAVIWCEDHGDLAYCRQSGAERPVTLDAGDWVHFDLSTDRNMRVALNPRLISEGVYQGLADVLGSPPRQARPDGPPRQPCRCSAEIIPFSARRAAPPAGHPGAAAHRA